MKFLALVSGGKDSYYAIQRAMEQGHELVACLHMARPDNVSEESYMYQSAASECVRIQVEECLQAPYIQFTREGTSRQTSLVYEQKLSLPIPRNLHNVMKSRTCSWPSKQRANNTQKLKQSARVQSYPHINAYEWRMLFVDDFN